MAGSLSMAAAGMSSLRSLGLGLEMKQAWSGGSSMRARRSLAVRAAGGTQKISGTRYVGGKKAKMLQVGDKSAKMRDKVSGEGASVRLLSRVEELRLLTKAEKAGLLSVAESLGLSLTTIEDLGLLSKAEELGLLSAATDPATPRSLLAAALLLLVTGPVFVYLVPEDSTALVVLQFLVAILTVVGGATALAASNFVSKLQQTD